ncbi:MAG: hypothetical protein MJ144_00450 [Clostridia bacterium]|nr:hypothetical protein [Clostridia bacterium]
MTDSNLTKEEQAKKAKAKKAAAIAIAAAIAAGGAAAAETPIDYNDIQQPTAIVRTIDDVQAAVSPDDDSKKVQQKESRVTVSKVLLAPVYALGAVLMKLFDMFVAVVLTPIAAVALKWVLFAAIVTGILALCLKIAFPDVPLRKMLTKKGILFILVTTAIVSAACEIIPVFAPDTYSWMFALKIAGGLAIMLPVFITVLRVVGKYRKAVA